MNRLFSMFFVLILSIQVSGQNVQEQFTVAPLSYSGSIKVNGQKNEVIERMNRAWKYSFGQEPAAKLLIKSPNELKASAQYYFKSETLTARNETRGVISYSIILKAEDGKCIYEIQEFVHRGNTTIRTGGIHFGRLMEGPDPDRKVRGLGRKNAQRIHEEMKNQLSDRLNKVLATFKQQLLLNG